MDQKILNYLSSNLYVLSIMLNKIQQCFIDSLGMYKWLRIGKKHTLKNEVNTSTEQEFWNVFFNKICCSWTHKIIWLMLYKRCHFDAKSKFDYYLLIIKY